MKTYRAYISTLIVMAMIAVSYPADASNDETLEGSRHHSKKRSRSSAIIPEVKEIDSKQRRHGRNKAPIKTENDKRTNAQFPHFHLIPSDLFWLNLAPYLELADVQACNQLSKAMQAQMKKKKAWLFEGARAHLKQFGIEDFTTDRLSLLIRFSVPLLPIVDGNIKQGLLRASRKHERATSLVNLYYFPATLKESLLQLKELNLSNCNLKDIPPAICQLSGLETLNLARNRLTSLPLQLGRLSSLRTLELWGNLFVQFPSVILECGKLVSLELGGNALRELPADIERLISLHTLVLSGNQLIGLPDRICELKYLERLYLRRNRELYMLPLKLGRMKSLQLVFLYGTAVEYTPKVSSKSDVKWIWSRYGTGY